MKIDKLTRAMPALVCQKICANLRLKKSFVPSCEETLLRFINSHRNNRR
jgi:hypothetical protein